MGYSPSSPSPKGQTYSRHCIHPFIMGCLQCIYNTLPAVAELPVQGIRPEQDGEKMKEVVVLRVLMGILGVIVAHFVVVRIHQRSRLGLWSSIAVTAVIMAVFTYFATWYQPPGDTADVEARIAEMASRRLFLICGEVAGIGWYAWKSLTAGSRR